MKIGLVCCEYPPRPHGGIGSFVQELARAFAADGHATTVVGWGSDPGEAWDGDVRVLTVRETATKGVAWVLNRRRLAECLEAEAASGRVEIVETPDFAGVLPFRLHGCPVVVRLHCAASLLLRQRGEHVSAVLRWSERRTLNTYKRWIGVSHFIVKATEKEFGIRPRSAVTIYSPAPDIPSIDAASVGRIRREYGDFILFVGSLTEVKGALGLAQAARVLLARRPRLRIVYLGRESTILGVASTAALRAEVGAALADRLVFAGVRPRAEVWTWMRAAKMVAFPSQLESFGLVAVEAMASGTPLIYTREASGPEIVTDGETGLLVNPRDPADIVEKIDILLDQPDLARRFVERAQEAVRERFSIRTCVDRTLSFYRETLAAERGAAPAPDATATRFQAATDAAAAGRQERPR
jgi:glycosyltransferase involved in cell wall biosynthesis